MQQAGWGIVSERNPLTIPHHKKISIFELYEAVTCSSAYEETVSLNVTGVGLPPVVDARTVNGPDAL